MNWVEEFYQKQGLWSGVYQDEVRPHHRDKVVQINTICGTKAQKILELGAGGGQCAAATADLGHEVFALELVSSAAQHAQIFAATRANMTVIQGDFYQIDPPAPFDVITYWDGFGVGDDTDQQHLLQRISQWLKPDGYALIDIYTPWYAMSTIGKGWQVKDAYREYGFDFEGCRWLDTWRLHAKEEDPVTQSLRCYSPADLLLLLKDSGLQLQTIVPGFGPDESGQWGPAKLEYALSYMAVLRPASSS